MDNYEAGPDASAHALAYQLGTCCMHKSSRHDSGKGGQPTVSATVEAAAVARPVRDATGAVGKEADGHPILLNKMKHRVGKVSAFHFSKAGSQTS